MSISNPSRDIRSARRFSVQVAVEVRSPQVDQEIAAYARDISHRGIFLYTENPLPENSPIEFTLQLKAEGAPEEGVRVLCSGTVVRVESHSNDSMGMAATIDSYRFLQSKKGNA